MQQLIAAVRKSLLAASDAGATSISSCYRKVLFIIIYLYLLLLLFSFILTLIPYYSGIFNVPKSKWLPKPFFTTIWINNWPFIIDKCARILLGTAMGFCRKTRTSLKEIKMIDIDSHTTTLFSEILQTLNMGTLWFLIIIVVLLLLVVSFAKHSFRVKRGSWHSCTMKSLILSLCLSFDLFYYNKALWTPHLLPVFIFFWNFDWFDNPNL